MLITSWYLSVAAYYFRRKIIKIGKHNRISGDITKDKLSKNEKNMNFFCAKFQVDR